MAHIYVQIRVPGDESDLSRIVCILGVQPKFDLPVVRDTVIIRVQQARSSVEFRPSAHVRLGVDESVPGAVGTIESIFAVSDLANDTRIDRIAREGTSGFRQHRFVGSIGCLFILQSGDARPARRGFTLREFGRLIRIDTLPVISCHFRRAEHVIARKIELTGFNRSAAFIRTITAFGSRIEQTCFHAGFCSRTRFVIVINKVNMPNPVSRLLTMPFSWAGSIVGTTARTTGGMLSNLGNAVESVSGGVGTAVGETFQGQFRAAGRSTQDAIKESIKAPIDLTRTALSGTKGLLQTTGDEVAFVVDPKGSKISSVNPKEQITIAFGCANK